MAASPPHDPILDFDLDSIFDFDSIPRDLFDDPPPDGRHLSPSGSPDTSSPSWVDEVERLLMADEEGEVEGDANYDDFLLISDVLVDGSDDGDSGKSVVGGCVATLDTNTAEVDEAGEGRSGEEVDDAVDKKRRRQLRNRDSAMKSRERRKLYIQDLEKKSKFFESECRRLQHLLQCCAAENSVLRHCLQKDRLHSVPGAKQESAVLFEESLLLGSLFWLVNIVVLFLAPNPLLSPNPVHVVAERARGLAPWQTREMSGARSPGKRSTLELLSEVVLRRRRSVALKRKMKLSPISSVFSPMQFSCIACN